MNPRVKRSAARGESVSEHTKDSSQMRVARSSGSANPLIAIRVYDSSRVGFILIPSEENGYSTAFPIIKAVNAVEIEIQNITHNLEMNEGLVTAKVGPAGLTFEAIDFALDFHQYKKANTNKVYLFGTAYSFIESNPDEWNKKDSTKDTDGTTIDRNTTMLLPASLMSKNGDGGIENHYFSMAIVKSWKLEKSFDQNIFIINLKLAGDENEEIYIDILVNEALVNFELKIDMQVKTQFMLYGYGDLLAMFLE